MNEQHKINIIHHVSKCTTFSIYYPKMTLEQPLYGRPFFIFNAGYL